MTNNIRNSKVDQLTTKDYDLHGRRITNAARSKGTKDYIIQEELKNYVTEVRLAAALKFDQLTQNLKLLGFVTFYKVATFLNGIVADFLYPSADSTTAFEIRKADGTTAVVIVNTTDGFAGIGSAVPEGNTTAGRRYFVVKGISNAGAIELVDVTADADNTTAGIFQVADSASLSTDKRLGAIIVRTDGATANDRGGAFRFVLKADGASGVADTLQLTRTMMGFFGATPTTKQTLNAYTTDPESSAYTGLATGLGGTPYASVANLNALRTAYENLRASYDDLRTKLQTTTLVG